MKRLRMLREKKQLTQSQLGKLTDISPSAIGMYEQGRREANHETLLKLANFLMYPLIIYLVEIMQQNQLKLLKTLQNFSKTPKLCLMVKYITWTKKINRN